MSSLCALLEAGAAGRGFLHLLDGAHRPADLWRNAEVFARSALATVGPSPTIAGSLRADLPSLSALVGTWRAGGTFVSIPSRPDPGFSDQLRGVQKASNIDLSKGRAGLSIPDAGGRLVQFTSGTTSEPVGILLDEAAIAANVLALIERLEVGPGDRCVSWLPLSHDMGLIGMVLTSLVAASPGIADASLTVLAPESFLRRPLDWLRACDEAGATITATPPFGLTHLLSSTAKWSGSLASIKSMIVGADTIHPEVLMSADSQLSSLGLSETALRPAFGVAENALGATMTVLDAPWSVIRFEREGLASGELRPTSAPSLSSVPLVSNGPPLVGVDVQPRGRSGELAIGGTSLFEGYVERFDEPLVARPRRLDEGLHPTGDTGGLVNGELFVTGRNADRIVLYGKTFHAELRERVASKALGEGAIVVQCEPDRFVVVVPRRTRASSPIHREQRIDLRRALIYVSGSDAASVHVLARRHVERTSSGKVRRGALRARFDTAT